MAENTKFNSTVESLFKGMDSFVSAKTVVGDAVTVNNTIIVPLVDVSFGVAAGAFSGDVKNNAGGGLGAKLSPSAVLVIQNDQTKLVNVKNQDTITKILDMIPDMVDKVSNIAASKKTPKDKAVDDAIKNMAGGNPNEE